jgi:hypothetical protein
VARAKTVVDLLAEQPSEELARMRQINQRELARARTEVVRLELEGQQIEAALAKRERGKPGRPGGLAAEQVLEAAYDTEPPMTAADVHKTLSNKGVKASVNTVRNHLNRLASSGDLLKDEHAKFTVPRVIFVPAEFSESSADDDIPF